MPNLLKPVHVWREGAAMVVVMVAMVMVEMAATVMEAAAWSGTFNPHKGEIEPA